MKSFIETVDVFTGGDNGVDTYRIPSLLVTPGGNLVAFCEARKFSRGDASPTDLVFKRSEDGGRTWSANAPALAGRGDEAIMNPTPVVDGDRILLFCLNAHKIGKRQHVLLMLESTDDGRSWSEPVEMGPRVAGHDDTFVPGPGVSVKLSSGRLVVPGNTTVRDQDGERMEGYARVMYSDDRGLSWTLGSPVEEDFSNECQAVELSDGTLMLNWRNQSGMYETRGVAISSDGGATWGPPSRATGLNDPVCQAGFIRCSSAADGEQNRLLFTNLDSRPDCRIFVPGGPPDLGGQERRNLVARLSYDEGASWPVKRLIHSGPAAYSCPARLPGGTFAVLYECGENHHYERLRLARFNLAWLEG